MVGFSGESAADFEETCFVAKTVRFSHIHTFKYPKRSGVKFAVSGNIKENDLVKVKLIGIEEREDAFMVGESVF